MPERIRASHFIVFLIVLGLSACGKDKVAPVDAEKQAFNDLREVIRESIDDDAREQQAIAIVGQFELELEALRTTVSTRKSRFRELNANYDASREEFDELLDDISLELKENRKKVGDQHLALLAITTPEERDAIGKAQTKAMKAAIKTMQAI